MSHVVCGMICQLFVSCVLRYDMSVVCVTYCTVQYVSCVCHILYGMICRLFVSCTVQYDVSDVYVMYCTV